MLLVKKLHPDAIAPTVTHAGEDLGYDLYALENTPLWPGSTIKVYTGIAATFIDSKFPECKYGLLIRDRSSLAAKGVIVTGGVIDAGYRGEIQVLMTSPLRTYRNVYEPALDEVVDYLDPVKDIFVIYAGDKIAQMIPMYVRTNQGVEVVEELPVSLRGEKGFGSSGQ